MSDFILLPYLLSQKGFKVKYILCTAGEKDFELCVYNRFQLSNDEIVKMYLLQLGFEVLMIDGVSVSGETRFQCRCQ